MRVKQLKQLNKMKEIERLQETVVKFKEKVQILNSQKAWYDEQIREITKEIIKLKNLN